MNRSVLAVFLGAMLLLSVSMSDSAFAEQKDTKKKSKTAEKKKLKPGFQPLKPKPESEPKNLTKSVKPAKPQPAKPKLQTQGSTTSSDMSGKWEGIATWSASFDYWDRDTGSYREACQYQGNFGMTLTQNGNIVRGDAAITNFKVTGGRNMQVCSEEGLAPLGSVDAKIFGSGFSGKLGLLDIRGSVTSDLIRGQVSGSVGELTIGGEFTGNRIFK